jgi:hypothetical protein
VAHFYEARKREDAFVTAQIQLPFFVTGFFDVNYGIANVDYSDAPLSYWPKKIDKFRGHPSFAVSQVGRWWRHFQTIFENDSSDFYRGE